jgi:hypothetical protein
MCSEHEVDDLLGNPVGRAEVKPGDYYETQHNGSGLRHLPTIGPLYALKLSPARSQEGDRSENERATRSRRGSTAAGHWPRVAVVSPTSERRRGCGAGRLVGFFKIIVCEILGVIAERGLAIEDLVDAVQVRLCSRDQRGVELIKIPRVLQRARNVGFQRLQV